jgi:hypothetical protein
MGLEKERRKVLITDTEQRREKDPGTGYNRGSDPSTVHQTGNDIDQGIPAQNSSKGIETKRWEH